VVDTLTDVVLIVTGFQLLLLAGILLIRLPSTNLRRNLLAAFLLTKALLILRWFSLRFGIVEWADLPGLYLSSAALFFALAPLLYLYIRSVCGEDFRLRSRAAVHFIPCAVVAALGLVAAETSVPGAGAAGQFLDQHFWRFFWTGNLTQILLYIVAMVRLVGRHRSRYHGRVSQSRVPAPGWLMALLAVIFLHWLFVTSRSVLSLLGVGSGGLTAVLDLFSITIFLVFTTALVVRGLANSKAFSDIGEPAQMGQPALNDGQLERCRERLQACMRFEKPHLDPSLTVDDLARRLAVPSWQLSKVLNTEVGMNFFHFVNAYRVEEAKRLLEDPSRNRITMLRLLHDVGFNSKSTFNEAFKRHTGMTPSEYRNQAQRPATVEGLAVER
jgi:AraC-like DNA-binding protein